MIQKSFFPMAATAKDVAMKMARANVEYWDFLAMQAKGTPAAAWFDMASKFQHTALENIESISGAFDTAGAPNGKAKQAAKRAAKPAADTLRKAVDAQADLIAETGATVASASKETAKAVKKAGKSAADADALYDDLTIVTGIGPATMKKLHSAGVRNVSDLSNISAGALNKILEDANVRMMRYSAQDWIKEAKSLVKAAK